MSDALYTSIPIGSRFGPWMNPYGLGPVDSAFLLDSATDRIEWVLQVEDTITITRLGIKFSSQNGNAPNFRISIQGVDASGNADGTILGGGSPAQKTFSPSALGWANATTHWLTLDNSLAVSRGDFIAIVIEYSSGTIDGANNATFVTGISGLQSGFPIVSRVNSGVSTRQNEAVIIGYGSASRKYGNLPQSWTGNAFNSGTSGADEYGNKFTLPAGWGETFQLLGCQFQLSSGSVGTGGITKMRLYGGADATPANSTGAAGDANVLQEIAFDHDCLAITTTSHITLFFTSLTTLYYGATYRLAFQPQSANDWATIYTNVAANDELVMCPGAGSGGVNAQLTKRLDAGNWTDVDTSISHMTLLLADITEPASSSQTNIFIRRMLAPRGRGDRGRSSRLVVPLENVTVSVSSILPIFPPARRQRQIEIRTRRSFGVLPVPAKEPAIILPPKRVRSIETRQTSRLVQLPGQSAPAKPFFVPGKRSRSIEIRTRRCIAALPVLSAPPIKLPMFLPAKKIRSVIIRPQRAIQRFPTPPPPQAAVVIPSKLRRSIEPRICRLTALLPTRMPPQPLPLAAKIRRTIEPRTRRAVTMLPLPAAPPQAVFLPGKRLSRVETRSQRRLVALQLGPIPPAPLRLGRQCIVRTESRTRRAFTPLPIGSAAATVILPARRAVQLQMRTQRKLVSLPVPAASGAIMPPLQRTRIVERGTKRSLATLFIPTPAPAPQAVFLPPRRTVRTVQVRQPYTRVLPASAVTPSLLVRQVKKTW
jgi:hypothetical protein